MYVLELIEDCGFDGIEVTSFLVSDSERKINCYGKFNKKRFKTFKRKKRSNK